MKVLVNISWCGEHLKGGDRPSMQQIPGAVEVSGATHAEWLERALRLLRAELPSRWELAVSATGFRGICQAEPGEQAALWRAFPLARWVTTAKNLDHQLGAAWNIRQGLKCAEALGCVYMIHTAEDILPWPGALTRLVQVLDAGDYDYAGTGWLPGVPGHDGGAVTGDGSKALNTQFFACRVAALADRYEPEGVRADSVEEHMARLLVGHQKFVEDTRPYQTTHKYEEWRAWAVERAKRASVRDRPF
jgi:hypothetical protein